MATSNAVAHFRRRDLVAVPRDKVHVPLPGAVAGVAPVVVVLQVPRVPALLLRQVLPLPLAA
eukprot:1955683-Alexandrium_andersonii.AAC.1